MSHPRRVQSANQLTTRCSLQHIVLPCLIVCVGLYISAHRNLSRSPILMSSDSPLSTLYDDGNTEELSAAVGLLSFLL